jgi:hypothetical protein
MQVRKTAKGSKNRIENRSHQYHPKKRKTAKGHPRGDPPVTLPLCHLGVLYLKNWGGYVDGRIAGIVGVLS